VAEGKWPVIGEREPASFPEGPRGWSLTITGQISEPVEFSLEELLELPQTRQRIDIHCVTRWSKLGVEFEGIALRQLLELFKPKDSARFVSFCSHSVRKHSSSMALPVALELETLIALRVDGQLLEMEHGGPIRNVVPGRYFYKSVKWLTQIELLSDDRLGFWEAESGYHNSADPWKEERYISSRLDRRETAELLAAKDFSGRDLMGISAAHRSLPKLKARNGLLRNSDFSRSDLRGSDFRGANLSNANLQFANLRECDFEGADLEGADFTGADLSGANLIGCSMIGCSFFNPELGESSAAVIDPNTKITEAEIAPLFPQQFALLRQRCRKQGLFG
jgi:hypothetical protein